MRKKIVLNKIGDMGVGKSCLLHQLIENQCYNSYFDPCILVYHDTPHTIGVEFGTKIINLLDKTIKLQIWDTAGQERFRAVTRSYYRGSTGVIMVYDITRRTTFNHISSWLDDARNLTNPSTVIYMVGNKSDLESQVTSLCYVLSLKRDVTYEEASQYANENGSGKNVENVFTEATSNIFHKIKDGRIDISVSDSGVKFNPTHRISLNRTSSNEGTSSMCSCS